jgi:hypothetical protein
VLRTIELILGLPPMSQFDAVANPMTAAFTSTPNMRPFTALPANVNLNAKNTLVSPMATASMSIDFSAPDRIPMRLMNEILWKSMRGERSQMPEPVRSLNLRKAMLTGTG